MAVNKIKYQDRLDRVINYIYDHLDEDIDLNRLAEIACLSPYHWHRVYRGMKGESIVATVKRLRLHRAATQLANTKLPLERVISRSGYSSASAFSRAFSDRYGMPPAKFRECGRPSNLIQYVAEGNAQMHEVEIKRLDEIVLVGLFHQGSYHEIGKAFEKLNVFGRAKGLMGPDMRSFGVYFDDPDVVETGELNSFAGIVETQETFPEDPFERVQFSGGRFAVMRFKGPYAQLPSAYHWFYGTWLVQTEQILRDAPCLEAYLNDPREVAPSDLLTDIFMPIE
ncbi:AraC family transcriptional regulator [Maritalea porphyrae]|uniref:AraC family transcriptional regulator n=1 Tax=Maritalea porphyrae TaxID=880732 RepID=UPI0022AF7EA1|nr:AraC family transcriptional regulator [Maritalea porphyrae]MCZ4273543.1 AraC family transcriptional regulator [Maritalea porphyrae]